jgi:hypothetical protein
MQLQKRKSLIVACLRPGPGIQVDTQTSSGSFYLKTTSKFFGQTWNAGKRGNSIAAREEEVKPLCLPPAERFEPAEVAPLAALSARLGKP